MKKEFNHKKTVQVTKMKTKKLCPNCGHDEFKKKDGFSLFGQRFVCAKCGGTFSRANCVSVNSTNVQVSGGNKTVGHSGKKQRHRKK